MKEAPADIAPPVLARTRPASILADYIELTNPRLNLLVVITSAGGYYLARSEAPCA